MSEASEEKKKERKNGGKKWKKGKGGRSNKEKKEEEVNGASAVGEGRTKERKEAREDKRSLILLALDSCRLSRITQTGSKLRDSAT